MTIYRFEFRSAFSLAGKLALRLAKPQSAMVFAMPFPPPALGDDIGNLAALPATGIKLGASFSTLG
jgi:hypothetical protein